MEKRKLKTVLLKNKPYVQVNERVSYFNETFKNGMITAEPKFLTLENKVKKKKEEDEQKYIKENYVSFNATIFPDATNKERFFTGHSFGEINEEKSLEKLETVAVGRALAFMGIGIVDSIASADEMQRFNNLSMQVADEIQHDELIELAQKGMLQCTACGSLGIKVSTTSGKVYCPNAYKDKDRHANYGFKKLDRPF